MRDYSYLAECERIDRDARKFGEGILFCLLAQAIGIIVFLALT